MKVYHTKSIRNIALLGHSGAGKTTLAECMLYEGGAITRRGTVQEGNTVSDHYNIEKERQNSVFASVLHVPWKDSKINIIDTPGYDDFTGEVISALKVADTAVIVLNATQGVEVGTELIWDYAQQFNTPNIFVINHLDSDKADYNQTLEQAQGRFGDKATVIQFPVEVGPDFDAIVDVLKMILYKFPKDGGKPEKHPIPSEFEDRAAELHEALVEAVAEYDEELMEAFFEEGTLTEEQLTTGMKGAMMDRELFPIFCASAVNNMGSGRIMGFLHDIAPAPADRPTLMEDGSELPCDDSKDTVLFFYKTLSEPHLGEMSYFKVISGTLKVGDDLYNETSRTGERFSQFYILNGKKRDSVNELRAGDLGSVVKLKGTRTNHTLAKKGKEYKAAAIEFPPSRIRAAIKTPSKGDLEKMAIGLSQIQKEDLTVLVHQSPELKQTIIQGQGEMHLNLVKYRIEKLYNINVEFEEPRIPYRETIRKMAESSYRHKKQSGGAGQFGEVHMRIEPYYEGMPPPANLNVRNTQEVELPWGGKVVYNNCIVGGTIDAKYMPSILKGVMKMMENGPITGSYVRDIRISVFDGKMHAVDSNDMAFQIAGAQAFKKAFADANPNIMEPIYEIEVLCTDDTMGDVMGDLQTRRAIIMGMDADGHYQKIKAHVPLKELYKYSSSLRALTQGRAKHTREFHNYGVVPANLQKDLASEHRAAASSK